MAVLLTLLHPLSRRPPCTDCRLLLRLLPQRAFGGARKFRRTGYEGHSGAWAGEWGMEGATLRRSGIPLQGRLWPRGYVCLFTHTLPETHIARCAALSFLRHKSHARSSCHTSFYGTFISDPNVRASMEFTDKGSLDGVCKQIRPIDVVGRVGGVDVLTRCQLDHSLEWAFGRFVRCVPHPHRGRERTLAAGIVC